MSTSEPLETPPPSPMLSREQYLSALVITIVLGLVLMLYGDWADAPSARMWGMIALWPVAVAGVVAFAALLAQSVWQAEGLSRMVSAEKVGELLLIILAAGAAYYAKSAWGAAVETGPVLLVAVAAATGVLFPVRSVKGVMLRLVLVAACLGGSGYQLLKHFAPGVIARMKVEAVATLKPQPVACRTMAELQQLSPMFVPNLGPRYWFYRSPDGQFEVYDRPGFHPVLGVELRPFDQQSMSELVAWIEAVESQAVLAQLGQSIAQARAEYEQLRGQVDEKRLVLFHSEPLEVARAKALGAEELQRAFEQSQKSPSEARRHAQAAIVLYGQAAKLLADLGATSVATPGELRKEGEYFTGSGAALAAAAGNLVGQKLLFVGEVTALSSSPNRGARTELTSDDKKLVIVLLWNQCPADLQKEFLLVRRTKGLRYRVRGTVQRMESGQTFLSVEAGGWERVP